MNIPADFGAAALRAAVHGAAVGRVLRAALRAVEPGRVVRDAARRAGDALVIRDRAHSLKEVGRVFILAAGKAAPGMAAAFVPLVEDRLAGGLVVAKTLDPDPPPGLVQLPGGHPVPDERSLAAGRSALDLLRGLRPGDLLVCLLSGGASALLAAPAPGVTLPDLQALTRSLLACGAPIDEINLLRRRLDLLKGGGLARMAAPARGIGLILSDVIGDPLETIASGMTVPDTTSDADAPALLQKYGLLESLPPAVVKALRGSGLQREHRIADPALFHNEIIANNETACRAAMAQARAEGWHCELADLRLSGEARAAGRALARQFGEMRAPACRIFGGETTVTLAGAGRGGRNQELALAAALEMEGMQNALLISLATDGEDGPTDAAGAVAAGDTLLRARAAGLDAADCLRRNDSYSFFSGLGDLLKTGPTGTNVNDLAILLKF